MCDSAINYKEMKIHIHDLYMQAGLTPGGLNSDGERDWIGNSQEWDKATELEATYEGEVFYEVKIDKDEDELPAVNCSMCEDRRVVTKVSGAGYEDDAIVESACPRCAY